MSKVIAVNEFDENPRLEDRKKVHSDGTFHRVSYLWVYNHEGRVLCHDRSISKGRYSGGLKLPFNGEHHSDKDPFDAKEGYLHAAMRAMEEEYRMDPTKMDFAFLEKMQINKSGKDQEFQAYFAARFDGDISRLKLKQNEITKVWWGDLENVVLGDPSIIKKKAVVIPFPGNTQRIQIITPMINFLGKLMSDDDSATLMAS